MGLEEIEALHLKGSKISMAEVIKLAKIEDSFPALKDKLRLALVEQFAEEAGLHVSKDELQLAINDRRKRLGLFTSAETTDWLKDRQLKLSDLVAVVRSRYLESKVKASFSCEQIEAYFAEQRLNFDRAHLSQIVLKDAGEALELWFQLEEGADFHQLARTYTLDEESRFAGGYIGLVARREMLPSVAAVVFGAKDGEIVGPIETKKGHLLIKVEQIMRAGLNERLETEIRDLLFEEWIEEREKAAEVRVTI